MDASRTPTLPQRAVVRAVPDSAIRLATWVSLFGVLLAVVATLAAVPQVPIVLAVMVIGFTVSLVRTAHEAPVEPAYAGSVS